MTQAHTIKLSPTAHEYAKKRAIGLLKLSTYDGMKLPFEEEEQGIWRDFIGTYTAIYDKLKDSTDKTIVASMYALNTAAVYVVNTRGLDTKAKYNSSVTFDGQRTEERIRGIFKPSLDAYLTQENRQSTLGGLLSHLAHQATKAAEPYATIANKYRLTKVSIDGKVHGSFSDIEIEYSTTISSEDRVVGNESMMQGLACALYGLAHFNGVKNPLLDYMKIPKTINIHGPPGCGKTIGINQAFHDAKTKYESQMKIPLEMIALTNKFKSSLFSESSERLRAIFKQANNNQAAYVIVADDIESMFHNRKHLDSSPEEKNIMNTLLNELEGLLSHDRGNYLFIATSNFPLQIDPALDQRLSELVLRAKGPQTAKEYTTLFKQKLQKGIDAGYVDVEHWDKIGKEASDIRFPGRLESTLSGRHVKDIIAGINAQHVLPTLPKNKILSNEEIKSALSKPLITEYTITAAIQQFAIHHEEFLDDTLAA